MSLKRSLLISVVIMVSAMWLLNITSVAEGKEVESMEELSVENHQLDTNNNIQSIKVIHQTSRESIPTLEASRTITVHHMVKTSTKPKETIPEINTNREKLSEDIFKEASAVWEGEVLNSYNGTVEGPSGKETYYNLDMSGVISIMKDLGYNYEFYVREDGVKMYGPYVMCAANLDLRPKGTILETTLGTAIVCDTGAFAQENLTQLDIAVDW